MPQRVTFLPVPDEWDLLPAVADALGTTRRRAHMAVRGPLNVARQCARVITALKSVGADEELVRFLQPIDLAVYGAQPESLRDEEPSPRDRAQAFLNSLYREIGVLPVVTRPSDGPDPIKPARLAGAGRRPRIGTSPSNSRNRRTKGPV